MRNVIAATAAALGLATATASAGTMPFGFTYSGNAVTIGSGGCSAVAGTFPVRASLLVDSQSGAVNSYYLNILIQNNALGSNGKPILPLQYITDVLSANTNGTGALVSYDPQLLGTNTALTGVDGSYTGQITSPSGTFVVLGTNFGQANQTSIVLTAPIAGTGQSCVLSLSGVLVASPD
jgi:hypothetical protein